MRQAQLVLLVRKVRPVRKAHKEFRVSQDLKVRPVRPVPKENRVLKEFRVRQDPLDRPGHKVRKVRKVLQGLMGFQVIVCTGPSYPDLPDLC